MCATLIIFAGKTKDKVSCYFVGKNPIVMSFQEPLMVINKYSYCLDVEIEGTEFNVDLPVGAVNHIESFEIKIKKALD